jgi:hypothetical protein
VITGDDAEAETGCADAARSSNSAAAVAHSGRRASERMLAEWRGKLARTKKEKHAREKTGRFASIAQRRSFHRQMREARSIADTAATSHVLLVSCDFKNPQAVA